MADDGKLAALEGEVARLKDENARMAATLGKVEAFTRQWEAAISDPAVGKLFGARPQSVYTQTYTGESHTIPAYTPDVESAAYTSTPAALADAATLADLNALRAAYETLRGHAEAVGKVTNAQTNDMALLGLVQKA